jgi:hypothetical protein
VPFTVSDRTDEGFQMRLRRCQMCLQCPPLWDPQDRQRLSDTRRAIVGAIAGVNMEEVMEAGEGWRCRRVDASKTP